MDDLRALWDTCWTWLTAGYRPQSLRWPVLATEGLGGGAEARMVVLRRADCDTRHVDLHIDRASTNVAELSSHPLATLPLRDADRSLQMCARIRIEIVTREAVRNDWEATGATERATYGAMPPPGAPPPASDAYDIGPSRDRFAVLRGQLGSFDVLQLGTDRHRRALDESGDDFAGRWLAP